MRAPRISRSDSLPLNLGSISDIVEKKDGKKISLSTPVIGRKGSNQKVDMDDFSRTVILTRRCVTLDYCFEKGEFLTVHKEDEEGNASVSSEDFRNGPNATIPQRNYRDLNDQEKENLKKKIFSLSTMTLFDAKLQPKSGSGKKNIRIFHKRNVLKEKNSSEENPLDLEIDRLRREIECNIGNDVSSDDESLESNGEAVLDQKSEPKIEPADEKPEEIVNNQSLEEELKLEVLKQIQEEERILNERNQIEREKREVALKQKILDEKQKRESQKIQQQPIKNDQHEELVKRNSQKETEPQKNQPKDQHEELKRNSKKETESGKNTHELISRFNSLSNRKSSESPQPSPWNQLTQELEFKKTLLTKDETKLAPWQIETLKKKISK
jgi:hypothetical protein